MGAEMVKDGSAQMRILFIYLLICFHAFAGFHPTHDVVIFSNKDKVDDESGSKHDTASEIERRSTPSDTSLRLLQPKNRSQVFTFTPEFSWRPLQTREKIDYRLIISDTNGKIAFDDWIGADTSIILPDSKRLNDLKTYYWTVYAQLNNQQFQSPVWSFWIDQHIGTDLVVKEITLKNPKDDWKAGDVVQIEAIIENSGPEDARQCFVKLFSGNVNRNYSDYFAHRKTIAIETVIIDSLRVNVPKRILLSGSIPYGFNHFFVTIEPGFGTEEIIDSNNQKSGIRVQTENRIVKLNGLFVLYPNTHHPEIGERRLNDRDMETIFQNIVTLKQYLWDHTQILTLDVDTLLVNRFLDQDDFTYQDDQWGYFLSPDPVISDVKKRYQNALDYDFIYVFYSWWNTSSYWSGYSGYTFNSYKVDNKNIAFLAQPQYQDQFEKGDVTIHEFIHLLDHFFEASGSGMFYSPHQRAVYTTFDNDPDYFVWIFETIPTATWFELKQGQILPRWEMDGVTGADSDFGLTNSYSLLQNIPNPFSQTTRIRYKIPPLTASMAHGVKVTLRIYDVSGNCIKILVNEQQRSGFYQALWDGMNDSGKTVASGLYFYELRIGEWNQLKKIVYFR